MFTRKSLSRLAYLMVGTLLAISAAALAGCDSPPAGAAMEEAPGADPTPELAPSPTPIASSPDVVVQGTADQPLTITYVGNSGYLIESGDTKVVIDSFFQWDSGCGTVPERYQQLMRESAPPFDGIDLILATHDHADHFDMANVRTYLADNPETAFASTTSAAASLGIYPDMEGEEDRLIGIPWVPRERTQLTVNGIDLEAMPLPHGDAPNLGFIINVGGYRLLHVGDLGADSLTTTLEPLQFYGLADEHIDVIFLPYHYMQGEEQRAVADFFDVSWLVPTHLYPCACFGPMGAGYLDTEILLGNYPDAIMLEEEMQRFIVLPVSG